MENAVITNVKPKPNVYSAKVKNLYICFSGTFFAFTSKFAFEFAETELTNNINESNKRKVTVIIPEEGLNCQIKARMVQNYSYHCSTKNYPIFNIYFNIISFFSHNMSQLKFLKIIKYQFNILFRLFILFLLIL